MENYSKNLSQLIRQRRIQKGLSQTELAALTGVSQPTVANWETGHHAPRPRAILKLRDALGLKDSHFGGSIDESRPAMTAFDKLFPSMRAIPVFEWPEDGAHIYSQPPENYIPYPTLSQNNFALYYPRSKGFKEIIMVFNPADSQSTKPYCLWKLETKTHCTHVSEKPDEAQVLGWMEAEIRLP